MSNSGIPLIDRAAAFSDRVAILDGRGEHTYGELLQASASVAATLLEGTPDLDEARVAFMVPPGFDYVAVQWGIWRAGGVALPLSLRDTHGELAHVVWDAGAESLVTAPEFEEAVRAVADEGGAKLLRTTQLHKGAAAELPVVDVERRASLLYTSGTTSRPKGVGATHANVQAQITSLVDAWEWSADDHILNALPFHHVHGIVNALACPLWVGATCEILPRFEAERVWTGLAGGEVTLYMAVPTSYKALIAAWHAAPSANRESLTRGASRLRLMVSGSDKLEVTTLEEWRKITGHVLLERYGMTEIGMALSNPLHGERVPGSVGVPLPGVQVRLVEMDIDAVNDTGEHHHGDVIEADGRPGELQVRGPAVFKEYWRMPEVTAAAFPEDDWFCTGDVAEMEDGRYRILGRASQDFAISGGENVNLKEVEEVVSAHPDIVECAVVGVPDEYWGKAVSAAVKLRDGAELSSDDLREWARERLAAHKLPRRLLVRDSLPRTAVGKVVKPAVVKLFEEAGDG